LTGVEVDDHHNKSHTHNGADGSGTVEHDDTANGTIANHDTGATGTELDTLTDGSNADVLHVHTSVDVITTAQSYYVSTTGNDTTGTGATGSRWATIQHALDEVYNKSWGAGSSATIYVEEGFYRADEITVRNKHCPWITIAGEDEAEFVLLSSVDNVSSVGGGRYDVTITVNTTANLTVGQYYCTVGVGDLRRWLTGAWEITSINSATQLIINVRTRSVAPATVGSVNYGASIPKVVMKATSGAYTISVRASYITVRDISLIGETNTGGILLKGSTSIVLGPSFSVANVDNFGVALLAASEAYLTLAFITDCQTGLLSAEGSFALADQCSVSSSDYLVTASRAVCDLSNCYLASGYQMGLYSVSASRASSTGTGIITDCQTGAVADLESLVFTAVSSVFYSSCGLNVSPAINTEGNRNSYMRWT
jgi:hypothetical protein